jgi:putative NADPH-quinone reductase
MSSSSQPASPQFLFLNASTRESGVVGNTEHLARVAAQSLPAGTAAQWLRLSELAMPAFVDLRHSAGVYPAPEGDSLTLLNATLAATDLVCVAPVYWYSLPSPLKLYFDHWSAWLRVLGLDFKARMAARRMWVITTSGDREKAQPMIDSLRLCAQFMQMDFAGALWGRGGAPGAVQSDAQALAAATQFFARPASAARSLV